VQPAAAPQLAFHSPTAWAQRLHHGELDAVLLAVAGASQQQAIRHPPRLARALGQRVQAIALGERPLLLLYQPSAKAHTRLESERDGDSAAWPPRGYLLPPPDHNPLLHRVLAAENRLPLHHCAATDPLPWLRQLAQQSLLLPAHLTLLTLSPWGQAGLVPLRPLQPLSETLWLLLRRGEASRPGLRELLHWWGGPRLQPPAGTAGTGRQLRPWWQWRWTQR
jgi:hypothetical protein